MQFGSWQAQLRTGKQLPKTQHRNGTFLEVLQRTGPANKRRRAAEDDAGDVSMAEQTSPPAAPAEEDLRTQLLNMQEANLIQQNTIQELTKQIQQLMSMLEHLKAEQTPVVQGGGNSHDPRDPDL